MPRDFFMSYGHGRPVHLLFCPFCSPIMPTDNIKKIDSIVGVEIAFQYVSFFSRRGIMNVTKCSQNIL